LIQITSIRLFCTRIPLRIPFRFGIVEIERLEHCVMRAQVCIGGRAQRGYSAENLVPKWFTKDPRTTPAEDVAELRRVVREIAGLAIGRIRANDAFEFSQQVATAAESRFALMPPLLRQLGVSFVERAVIDAVCRFHDRPIHALLREGLLGRVTGQPLPPPRGSVQVRHTVGLGDSPGELAGALARTGIRRLKVKLSGDPSADTARLVEIAAVANRALGGEWRVTLDGNENYQMDSLRAFLSRLETDPDLAEFRRRLRWIEQPLHRDTALSSAVAGLLAEYPKIPFIIDESDAEKSSLRRALSLGYAGTTHKNCKGVFKSVAAACDGPELLAGSGREFVLSGEDLTIVAPWAQTADLATAATVGVVDIERNGQHYADGLSAFAPAVGGAALAEHPDLYRRDERGGVELRIEEGMVRLDSVLSAPFGSRTEPDVTGFEEIAM